MEASANNSHIIFVSHYYHWSKSWSKLQNTWAEEETILEETKRTPLELYPFVLYIKNLLWKQWWKNRSCYTTKHGLYLHHPCLCLGLNILLRTEWEQFEGSAKTCRDCYTVKFMHLYASCRLEGRVEPQALTNRPQ